MTPFHERVVVSRQELSALEGRTRHLCDLMTVLLYRVDSLPANQGTPEFERVMVIAGIVAKTEQTVKQLLEIHGRIQEDLAAKRATA